MMPTISRWPRTKKIEQKYNPHSFLPTKDQEREAVQVRRWVPAWYRHTPTPDSGGGEIRSHPCFLLWHAPSTCWWGVDPKESEGAGFASTLTLHRFFSTTHNLYLLPYFMHPNFLQRCVTTSLSSVVRLDCGKGKTQMGTTHNRIAIYDHLLWECVLLPFFRAEIEKTSAIAN